MTQIDFEFCNEELELPVHLSVLNGNSEPDALYMALHRQPCTEAAKGTIDALAMAIGVEAELKRRPSTKFRFALGATVADLFEALACTPPKVGRRHMKSETFSGRPVGHKAFAKVMKLMKQTGFIEVTDGIWFRRSADGEGRLTLIKPTPKLLRFTLERGVTPARHDDHFFRLPRPKSIPDPVKLFRERKTFKGVKSPKSVMVIHHADKRAAVEGQRVNRLNAYFAQQVISPDCHFAFQRQFHDGDVEGFDWNMGGRLYSLGDSYQQLSNRSKAGRTVFRRDIRINGSATVEIDIGASHLRIIYAHGGQPLDPSIDPYLMDAFPRDVVKDFITMTLGYTGFQRAWSPRKKEWYADPEKGGIDLQKTYPIAKVRKAVLDHLPLLQGWKDSLIRWPQLQFIESQAIFECMEVLAFEYDVPALPVHDSIIVPAEHQALAAEVLTDCFKKHVGVLPMVKINGHQQAVNDV